MNKLLKKSNQMINFPIIIAPAVEELACEFEGQVKMGILDIDENRELADKFEIYVLPTLLKKYPAR